MNSDEFGGIIVGVTHNTYFIKQIDRTIWMKTLPQYPQSFGHIQLLFSVFDKMDLFRPFPVKSLINMDAVRLDITYAILRISNNIANYYIEFIVKNVFLEKLYNTMNLPLNKYHDRLIDQLIQDISDFVNETIRLNVNEYNIYVLFCEHLSSIFTKPFYSIIFGKLSHTINNMWYVHNKDALDSIVTYFIWIKDNPLANINYKYVKYIDKAFDVNTSQDQIDAIFAMLKKKIELSDIMNNNCMEIDVYAEKILEDSIENTIENGIENSLESSGIFDTQVSD